MSVHQRLGRRQHGYYGRLYHVTDCILGYQEKKLSPQERGALGSIWELLSSEMTYTMSGHINDLEHHVLGLDLSCSDLRWQNKAVNFLTCGPREPRYFHIRLREKKGVVGQSR